MHKITVCHCVFSVYTGYTHNKPICCLPGALLWFPPVTRCVAAVWPELFPAVSRCVLPVVCSEWRPWRVAPWRGGLLGLVVSLLEHHLCGFCLCLEVSWKFDFWISVDCVLFCVVANCLCLLFGSFLSISWKFDFWISVDCVLFCVVANCLCLLFGSFLSISWKFDFWISVDCVLFCVVANCLCLLFGSFLSISWKFDFWICVGCIWGGSFQTRKVKICDLEVRFLYKIFLVLKMHVMIIIWIS